MKIRGGVIGSMSVVDDRQALTSPFVATVTSANPFGGPPWNNPDLIKAVSGDATGWHYSGPIIAGEDVTTNWVTMDFGRPIWCESVNLVTYGAQDSAQIVGNNVGFRWALYRGLASSTEALVANGADNNGFSRSTSLAVKQWLRFLRMDFGRHRSVNNGLYGINAYLDCLQVRGSR